MLTSLSAGEGSTSEESIRFEVKCPASGRLHILLETGCNLKDIFSQGSALSQSTKIAKNLREDVGKDWKWICTYNHEKSNSFYARLHTLASPREENDGYNTHSNMQSTTKHLTLDTIKSYSVTPQQRPLGTQDSVPECQRTPTPLPRAKGGFDTQLHMSQLQGRKRQVGEVMSSQRERQGREILTDKLKTHRRLINNTGVRRLPDNMTIKLNASKLSFAPIRNPDPKVPAHIVSSYEEDTIELPSIIQRDGRRLQISASNQAADFSHGENFWHLLAEGLTRYKPNFNDEAFGTTIVTNARQCNLVLASHVLPQLVSISGHLRYKAATPHDLQVPKKSYKAYLTNISTQCDSLLAIRASTETTRYQRQKIYLKSISSPTWQQDPKTLFHNGKLPATIDERKASPKILLGISGISPTLASPQKGSQSVASDNEETNSHDEDDDKEEHSEEERYDRYEEKSDGEAGEEDGDEEDHGEEDEEEEDAGGASEVALRYIL